MLRCNEDSRIFEGSGQWHTQQMQNKEESKTAKKKKTHINLEVQDLLRVTNHLHIWCMRWSGKFWCNKILNWNSSKMLTVQNQRNSVKLTISNFYRFKNVHCFLKKKQTTCSIIFMMLINLSTIYISGSTCINVFFWLCYWIDKTLVNLDKIFFICHAITILICFIRLKSKSCLPCLATFF